MPGRTRPGFRPPPGALAATWLSRPYSFGCERVFYGTHGSPGARRTFLGVFSKPGWLHTRRKRLFDLAGSLDGRFGLAGGARRVDSACFAPRPAPKRRRPCSVPGLRRRRRGRDAENSGFCTARAGVRWGGKGRLRLFMHDLSEVMQDDRAPCAGYPYWARHAPDVRRVRSAPYANQKVRAVSLHCAMPGDNSFYLLGGLSAEKVFTAAEDDVSYRLPNRVVAKQLFRSVLCV